MLIKPNTFYRVKRNQLVNNDGNPQKSLFLIGTGTATVYFSPLTDKPTNTSEMYQDTQAYEEDGSPYEIVHDFEWLYWSTAGSLSMYIKGMMFEEVA